MFGAVHYIWFQQKFTQCQEIKIFPMGVLYELANYVKEIVLFAIFCPIQ